MKRVVKYLSFCFICLAGFDAQALLTIYGERYAPTETFTEDILVTDGARVEIDKMYMNKTITLENHGYIQGDVIVNPVCDLYVENYGVHSGKIFIESGTSLLQRVKGADSLTGLDVVGDYQVEIHSPEVLSLSDVIANTGGAAIVTIKDTDILITDGVVANSGKIYLDGDIKFYINGFAEDSKQVVMKNVSGDFSSSFIDLGNDVLYAGTGYLEDGILYVQRVRETDYVKIFENEFGYYLNDLRMENESDLLLLALDNAKNMHEINSIVGRAARFNPIKLMDPVRALLIFDKFQNDFADGVGVSGDVVLGNDFNSYGMKLNLGGEFENWTVGISLGAGTMFAETEFDEYGAMIYSGRVAAKYDFENRMFVRGAFGTMLSALDIDTVFVDNKVVDSPYGYAMFANADVGFSWSVDDSLIISPFVGIDMDRISIESDSENGLNLRTGFESAINYSMSGIKYEYGLRTMLDTDIDYALGAYVSVWSIADELGGNVNIILTNQDGNMAYKFSVGARMKF